MQITSVIFKSAEDVKRLKEKEVLLLSEIGLDQIPAATNFVEFFAQSYSMSQSGVWYTLKKLKKERVVDFTEKGEAYRPLALTDNGLKILRSIMLDEKRKIMSRPSVVGGR
ncbi:MAG: hypothetical protein ACP5M9_02470 [Candidatus Micrarchaeia archaeon]